MKFKPSPLLLALLALLLLAGVFYWNWNDHRKKDHFDWDDKWSKNAYNETSKEPYGTYIFRKLLNTYFPGYGCINIEKDIAAELPVDSLGVSDNLSAYVFVGEALYLDSLDTNRLLKFAKAGNVVLIASKTIPFDLMFHLYFSECDGTEWDDYTSFLDSASVAVSLKVPALSQNTSIRYARQNKLHSYTWHYMESEYFCADLAQRPLGYLNDSLINFAEFPCGAGRFLLHTNPLVFTNYTLLRPETRPYVAGILSHLPPGNIYWDAVSRIPEQVGRRRNGNSDQLPDEHPLKYILKQPALAWAWYLLFALAGLWLIFRGKRRQQVIPILPKNENTSWQFITAIANLHFRERNYRGMAREQMRLFLAWLRERYNVVIPLQHDTGLPRADAELLKKIAQLSEISESKITAIFNQYTASIRYEPTEDMMINLHTAIENFMKQAK